MGKVRTTKLGDETITYESYKQDGGYYHVPRGEHANGCAYDCVQSMKEDIEKKKNKK